MLCPADPRPPPEPLSPPYVGDPAEGADGRAPVHVLLAGHVLGQAVEHKEAISTLRDPDPNTNPNLTLTLTLT